MIIEESLRNLREQFSWESKIENHHKIRAYDQVILCGMGGSRLASGFLKMIRPDLNLRLHNDYGLPNGYFRNSLVIISSYSGNTEEALGNFHAAKSEGLLTAVIASGGELLDLAKREGTLYVQIPPGHVPRLAAGYNLKALLVILGDIANKETLKGLSGLLDPIQFEMPGKGIAESVKGTPIIYSSKKNQYLAEHWKISFNETSKSPSFWNVLPELAHNELAALPTGGAMSFILLHDPSDHPRIQIKMGTLENLLKQKGFMVQNINLPENIFLKIFTSFTLANWAALHLAKKNIIDPEDNRTIEEFKC